MKAPHTLALTLLVARQSAAFIPGSVSAQRRTASRLLSSSGSTPSWRYQVDDLVKAVSPWGSFAEAEIIATDLVKQLPEVLADVKAGIERGNFISEVVVGEGTEARASVDGFAAVNRQLRQDILPQALEAAPRVAKAVSRRGTGQSVTSEVNRRTGPMEGVAEALYSIKNASKGLTPDKIRQGLQTVAAETENVFSRTPSGLYSPDYALEDTREGFEVRRYASYAVCSAVMKAGSTDSESETLDGVTGGSGEGFNTLAGYLFGNNTESVAMDMTTPVNIDVSPTGARTMSFVLPQDVPAAGGAPVPRDPRVNVNDIPTEMLAVREFAGFATDGEVSRQLDSLLWALQLTSASSSPWSAEDPTGKSYRLMQYNPPYTLPFRRTNAVAVRVFKGTPGGAGLGSVEDFQEARDEVSSTISQSGGRS